MGSTKEKSLKRHLDATTTFCMENIGSEKESTDDHQDFEQYKKLRSLKYVEESKLTCQLASEYIAANEDTKNNYIKSMKQRFCFCIDDTMIKCIDKDGKSQFDFFEK